MDSSPPSEVDYAERMTIENNKIDIEITNQEMERLYSSSPFNNTVQQPPQNEAASNNRATLDPSTDPVIPSAIPYEANFPADPNLWDSHFGLVSLFGTNKFLQSDTRNILCFLIRIAQFIRQRNIFDCNGNTISQLNSFGEAAFDFISAIHEAGWNKLNTLDSTPIRHKIKGQFGNQSPTNKEKTKHTTGNIPPCIPPRLPHKQVEEIRKRLNQKNNKKNTLFPRSYTQVSSQASDILKLKEAFLALPNRKILKIHNASLDILHLKGKKKLSLPLKVYQGNKPLSPS